MKKKWKKPELIVLVRSRPEESVLAICKTGGETIPPHEAAVLQGCSYTEGCAHCERSQDS